MTQVTDYQGNQEITRHDPVVVTSSGMDLSGYAQDLSPGIHPNEELEAELVRVTGATVTAVTALDAAIRYGTAVNVVVRLPEERLVCLGATVDLVAVVTEWAVDGVHRIQLFAAEDLTRIDTSGCGGGGRTPLPGDLLINELLSDPPGTAETDLEGDANCDGLRHGTSDEFIELVNVSADTLDLSEVTIADAVQVRYQFGLATSLPPGQAVVVFGGGDPAEFCSWPGGVQVFAVSALDGLGLSNSGAESIIVSVGESDAAITISRYDFTGSGSFNQSLTLSPDLNDTDPDVYRVDGFVRHSTVSPTGALFSPGTRLTGLPFP